MWEEVRENGRSPDDHCAAAFGALNVLRYLHKQGASFETINAVSLTP